MNLYPYALPLLVLLGAASTATAQELTVMTYNIRVDVPSDGRDAWPNRRAAVAGVIRGQSPDLVGVQEALPHQLAFLDSVLTDHDYIGEGRDGEGGGEYSALFYRRDRLEVLADTTVWLSPTPAIPSVGWGAAYPRIATYGRFRERGTEREFAAVNTHLDHESAEARERGLTLIMDLVDALAEPGLPVVLMGDLNAEPRSHETAELRRRYDDARRKTVAPPLGPAGTFVGFGGEVRSPQPRIDYLLLRRGTYGVVDRYATVAYRERGRYPSDHLPIVARVRLAQPETEAAEELFGASEVIRGDYGRDFVEAASFGVGLGLTVRDGVTVLGAGPVATSRVAPGVAVGGSISYVRASRSNRAVSGVGFGLFGRFYLAGGAEVDPFVEVGLSAVLIGGEMNAGAGLAPGLALAGPRGRPRAVLGLGGLVLGTGAGEGQGASNLGFVLAPSIGIEGLIGQLSLRKDSSTPSR